MNIVIFHYHLKTGGVTSIIRSQVHALKSECPGSRITLLTGGNPENRSFPGADIITEPMLNYLDPGIPDREIPELFTSIKDVFRENTGRDTVLHAHNLSLGKNPLVTAAVSGLAAEGWSVLNHAHDFPEDRPERMDILKQVFSVINLDLESAMYSPRMEYALLNSFDRNRILSKGIPEHQVHFLPNPVPSVEPAEPGKINKARETVFTKLELDSSLPLFVYPVRAIRRKNIGEFILFASALRDRANWIITRAPKNPVEVPLYETFRDTASAVHANIRFEAGEQCAFEDIMFGCNRIITTSIQEGFGMAFLEPWMYGRPVAGRDIPMVTDDFRKEGLKLNALYSSVPAEVSGGQTDFSSLDIDTQIDIIHGSAGRPDSVDSRVTETLFADIPAEETDKNKAIITDKYSESAYGQKLCRIYTAMSEQH